MPQAKFLEQIADYYTTPGRVGMLADITFIFPNKRSALFLKRYIQQRVNSRFTLMPRFTTFGRFASRTVRVAEASRYELLFMLYRSYRQALMEQHPEGLEQVRDFDKFIFWGDMILNDFDEIDKALADPAQLYKNLEAFKEITSDYLTQEQKDIIRRIWGETNLTGHIQTFWLHTQRDNPSELTRKFISLWQILGRIYDIFQERLHKANLTTPGKQLKQALVKLKDTDNEQLRRRRYVFVGLSDVSNAEIAIMDRLNDLGVADFFWDLESPLFRTPAGTYNTENRAIRFISRLKELFPMPKDFYLEPVVSPGRIDVIGIPSAMAQGKYAGETIRKMLLEGKLDAAGAINTAIVVPDTSQLMHLMLGLPDNLPGVNVTMGLPYSSTNFATLFRSIISMQRRMRKNRGDRHTFFYQDVLQVLVHPHLQVIDPHHINSVRQFIYDQRQFNIDATQLAAEFPELATIFRPVGDTDNLKESYQYIVDLLDDIGTALRKHLPQQKVENSFELDILKYFKEQVAELHRLIEKYDIDMRGSTFMTIFERILQSKTINVEGTPLQGLQVMGVLETRALDFDNIIFMDMNERTFPRRDYVKTMIPNNLRRGYGLPPIEQNESFYSYYFLRAISRSSHVTLLYDTRPPGQGAGELSRYVSQLLYLFNSDNIRHLQIELNGKQPATNEIKVSKTPGVLKQLDEFKREGGKNISASALKTYLKCPLQFYLQFVVGLRESDDPTEYMDEAEIGTIFHNTVERLYRPYRGKLITEAVIDEMLSEENFNHILIEEIAKTKNMAPEHSTIDDFNLEARMLKGKLSLLIRQMFEREKIDYCQKQNGFIYIDGEKEIVSKWKVCDGLEINFKMLIDRIDQIDGNTLRFIDYKTGKDDPSIGKQMSNLFTSNHTKHAVFQLLVYAEAYHDLVDANVDIRPALHIVKKILANDEIAPISFNGKALPDFAATSKMFRPMLNELLEHIFDSETPFSQCEDTDSCRMCPFLSLCGRNLPPEHNR